MITRFRFFRLLVVFAFAVLFAFPLIQRVFKPLPDQPLQENRHPAEKPSWGKLSLQGYLMGWQTWFNDRYDGRNFLIRLKTQIDYSAFSYSDKIHIGPDRWLFYRNVIDAEETNIESFSDASFNQVIANFRELNRRLAARGIRLLIVDNELKDAFYPEYLPHSLPRRNRPSRYSVFRKRLAEETGAEFIDSTAILSAIKSERTVFHRTDFHWNDPAAFMVAKAIVDRIAVLTGDGAVGWKWRLEITRTELSGGEAAFMPLLKPVTETALFVKKTWPDLPQIYREKDGPFEFSIVHPNTETKLLPPLVVFGDSFFDGMIRSGFIEHFQSVHRVRTHQADLAQTLAGLPKGTRFVLVQFIETALPVFSIPLPPEPAT